MRILPPHNDGGCVMKKAAVFGLLSVALLGSAHADPSESYSGFNNIRFGITDVNPNDGIGASFQVVASRVTTQLGTGLAGAPPTPADSTTTMSFNGAPGIATGSLTGDGAFAAYSIGPDSIMSWGNSGAAGSFYSTVSISFDILMSPGAQLTISGDLVRGMFADRNTTGVELDPAGRRLAAVDSSMVYSFGSPAFGDGGPFMKYGLYPDFQFGSFGPLGSDASTADRWAVEQAFSFSIPGYSTGNNGGIRTVAFTVGALGSAYIAPAIPEPSTYALMCAGLAAIGYFAKRRRA